MSNADDVRWLAQKVVSKAFHAVTDASVEALARRVLELEGAVEAEREACAVACDAVEAAQAQWVSSVAAKHCADAIRGRGGK